jgi:hypothetical protein
MHLGGSFFVFVPGTTSVMYIQVPRSKQAIVCQKLMMHLNNTWVLKVESSNIHCPSG